MSDESCIYMERPEDLNLHDDYYLRAVSICMREKKDVVFILDEGFDIHRIKRVYYSKIKEIALDMVVDVTNNIQVPTDKEE